MSRVLVIDDNASVRRGLAEILRSDGLAAHAMSSLSDVETVLREFRPDVVVLDLLMTGFSGVQFFDILKQASLHRPAVILYSDLDRKLLRAASRVTAPFAVLSKAGGTRALRRAVGCAVAMSEERATPGARRPFAFRFPEEVGRG